MTIFNILNLIFLQRFFLLLVDVGKEVKVGEQNEEDGRIGHNDLKIAWEMLEKHCRCQLTVGMILG